MGDQSVDETISQSTLLSKGNYEFGFDYYLTANGLAQVNNSKLKVTVIGTTIIETTITAASTAQHWIHISGVANIATAGYYDTALVFNSNGFPSKDFVIDRVFAIRTNAPPTVIIAPTPTAPAPFGEPCAAMVLFAGLGMFAIARRRAA